MKTTTFNESDKFVIILAIGNQLCKRCDSILFYKEYKSKDSGVLQRTVERVHEEVCVLKRQQALSTQKKTYLISEEVIA